MHAYVAATLTVTHSCLADLGCTRGQERVLQVMSTVTYALQTPEKKPLHTDPVKQEPAATRPTCSMPRQRWLGRGSPSLAVGAGASLK
jgi:hypothetical protein